MVHLTHCPFCVPAAPLRADTTSSQVWGLSYSSGFQKLSVRRKRCDSCRALFLGCWAYSPGGHSRTRIACHPRESAWFFFRERIHAGSFVAMHVDYLRFMTTAFIFLRASFSGLVKTVHAMFPGHRLNPNDCQRCLEHGWFLHSALSNTWSEAELLGEDFDLRLDSLDATLLGHEPRLRSLLHQTGSTHHCGACANPVLTGDGGMKLTTSLCNERTSASLRSEELGLSIPIGCTCRPIRGSLFCRAHQADAAEMLPPEIRDHRRVTGQGRLSFRYTGSDDFLPVQSMSAIRLRQYDSRLALLDYAAADPTRFAPGECDPVGEAGT